MNLTPQIEKEICLDLRCQICGVKSKRVCQECIAENKLACFCDRHENRHRFERMHQALWGELAE